MLKQKKRKKNCNVNDLKGHDYRVMRFAQINEGKCYQMKGLDLRNIFFLKFYEKRKKKVISFFFFNKSDIKIFIKQFIKGFDLPLVLLNWKFPFILNTQW